jgi:hypothetical protein
MRSPCDGMLKSMFQDMMRMSVPRVSGAVVAGVAESGVH